MKLQIHDWDEHNALDDAINSLIDHLTGVIRDPETDKRYGVAHNLEIMTSAVMLKERLRQLGEKEPMLNVYMEHGSCAELIAKFCSEETYMACLPALEAFALACGSTLSESWEADQ